MKRLQKTIRWIAFCCALYGLTLGVHAQAMNQMTVTGTFHVIRSYSQNHDEHIAYMLSEANGHETQLVITEDVLEQAGGVDALNRQQVRVQMTQERVVPQALIPMTVRQITRIGTAQRVQSRVAGSQPWITLMCKFSDIADEPKDYAYFAGMYGATYPGLNHYWQEQSYSTMDIDGSAVAGTGWFTLPSPRSTYVVNGSFNHTLATQDCANAADSVVNFRDYTGINMMFNDDLTGVALGGGVRITVDGVDGWWNATWMPPWGYSHIALLKHEMGHGYGLSHSSGQYGATYDSSWDVMSDAWWNCGASSSATYGCLGQHTIAYHKDKLGWIPSTQKYIASGSATIVIDDLAMASTTHYRMAQIAKNKLGTRFYTVEVRKLTGYDVKLPGFAVVIHEVYTNRDRQAQVIDSDNNGNTGDAGAMWVTGETFIDASIGLTVAVNAQTTDGYSVTISIPNPTPTLTPTLIPIPSMAGVFEGWGQSSDGQITAPNSDADIVDISAGTNHTLALRANGRVTAWGDNGSGQISVPTTLTNVVAVDAGDSYSLALKSDGTVVGWGIDYYGRVVPPSDLRNVVAISAGYIHSLALQSDGTVVGWGFNGYGETSLPETVENVIAISANVQSSMAVLANGRVIAWGFLGSSNQLAVPSGLTNVVDIAVGTRHAVALHANGTVTTWGDNDKNQQNVPIGLTDVVEIDTRAHHTIARKANGTVVVWGNNEANQANVPATGDYVRGVAAGANHSVVFRSANIDTATSTHTATQMATSTWTQSGTPTQVASPTHTATRTRTTTQSIPRTMTFTPTRTPTLVRPGAFSKTGPGKNSVNRPINLALSWSSSPFVVSYEYCVSRTSTCTVWKNVGNVRSTLVKNLLRNTSYYWHVRAKNRVGVTNANDGMWKFTTVR